MSDGHTSLRARLSADAVRRFQAAHNLRITEISGGIVHPSTFQIVATPYGTPDRKVTLDVDSFRYRKGSRYIGTVGHPHNAALNKDIEHSLNEIGDLHMAALNEPSLGYSQTNEAEQFYEQEADPIGDITDDEVISIASTTAPLSQQDGAEKSFESQNLFATQAQMAPRLPRGPRAVPEISMAQGTNLARPVALPRTDNLAAAQLLRSLGRQIPAQSVMPAAPPSPVAISSKEPQKDEPSRVSLSRISTPAGSQRSLPQSQSLVQEAMPVDVGDAEVLMEPDGNTSGGVALSEHHECQREMDHDNAGSIAGSREDSEPENQRLGMPNEAQDIGQPDVSHIETSVNGPMRGVPDARYVSYAKRHLPIEQQKLIGKPSSWLPLQPGELLVSSNIPVRLLDEFSDSARAVLGVTSKHSAFRATASLDDLENNSTPHAQHEVAPSVESEDDEEIEDWPSSPPEHREHPLKSAAWLPPDSSAEAPPPRSPSSASEAMVSTTNR